LSDKITSFEDYKNKAVTPEPVSQDTMNIEIEDPYQFLSADEREEYIRQRQKEQGESAPKEQERDREEERPRPEERRKRPSEPRRRPPREQYEPEDDQDYDEEYDCDEEYYEEDEDGDDGDASMKLVVRIASIITGVVILAFIVMLLKVKVYDRYLAPDPDEAPAASVAVAIPAGFVEKNDTVVVTGASTLNIRSVPSSASSETVVGMVPEGDELKRIAVSEDGSWALVEVDGQQVYASMKYLKEK
jgi:hypothetical protein